MLRVLPKALERLVAVEDLIGDVEYSDTYFRRIIHHTGRLFGKK